MGVLGTVSCENDISGNVKDEELFLRYKGNWGGDIPSRGEVCTKTGTGSCYIGTIGEMRTD